MQNSFPEYAERFTAHQFAMLNTNSIRTYPNAPTSSLYDPSIQRARPQELKDPSSRRVTYPHFSADILQARIRSFSTSYPAIHGSGYQRDPCPPSNIVRPTAHLPRSSMIHASSQASHNTETSQEPYEDAQYASQNLFIENFPSEPALQQRADMITRQTWFTTNQKEPCGPSLFIPFFDNDSTHQCRWVQNGERCAHKASRPARAIAHAYKHFNYQPATCDGRCGKPSCTARYEGGAQLKNHIQRAHEPRKQCDKCKRDISIQNMARHLRIIHYV